MKIRISHGNEDYWKAFQALPAEIQKRAREAYRHWREDPFHPSLHFKQVHEKLPVYSVRVGIHWRALGVLREDVMIWFWIGPHSKYDQLLSQFRRGRASFS